jgi:hypothetical protein
LKLFAQADLDDSTFAPAIALRVLIFIHDGGRTSGQATSDDQGQSWPNQCFHLATAERLR